MTEILIYMSGLAEIRAGVENYILNLYNSIDKSKYHFTVLTRNSHKGSPLYNCFIENGINIIDLNIHNLGPANFCNFKKSLNTFFSEQKGKYSFLHMQGCDDPFVVSTAKKYGIKRTAVHAHQINKKNSTGIKSFFKIFSSSQNIKKADMLFACSDAAGKSYFKDKKFTVIKNTIDTDCYKYNADTRSEMRKSLNLQPEDIAFCFVGRFAEVKNLHFLLDVFCAASEKNANTKLFMIGNGEMYNELQEHAKQSGISDRVCFTGERHDINKLLQAMDIYLQPSLSEGFPMSVLEAQASGLLSVVSDSFSDAVCITDFVYRLGLDKTPDAWAQDIFTLWKEHNSRDRQNGAQQVKNCGYDSNDASGYMCLLYNGEEK